jgi:cytochrome c-type biogenesis protein
MQPATDVTLWLALSAGVLSFLSPCTLPIFPAYLSYITGVSVKDLNEKRNMKLQGRLLLHALFFLLGMSTVFLSLGLSVSFIGEWLQTLLTGDTGLFVQRIAGIFLVLIGLVVGGWIKIPFLMQERRMRIKNKPAGLFGSFFVGIGFSAGWTPCIGPIFASILILAATSPAAGAMYTVIYIMGFSLPFLLFTFFLGSQRWLVKYSEKLTKVGGILIILFGLLLFTGELARLSNWLLRLVEDTWFENLG